MVSDAKCISIHREWHKILIPKQMLQKISIALTQVEAGNTSENLLNQTNHIFFVSRKRSY